MTRPQPRTPEYLTKPPRSAQEYEVFISSGSDLLEQRDRFEALATVFTKQAIDAGVPYRIITRRWEDATTRRTYGDGNAEFRHDAANAHLIVVLLHEDLRLGTREELDEAIKCSNQVAIIWMDPPPAESRKRDVKELRKALDDLRSEVRWEATGKPGSDASVDKMIAVLARTFIHAAWIHAQKEVPFNETR